MKYSHRHYEAVHAIHSLALSIEGLTKVQTESLDDAISEVAENLTSCDTDGNIIIRDMLGVIMDGLIYGNWPWVPRNMGTPLHIVKG